MVVTSTRLEASAPPSQADLPLSAVHIPLRRALKTVQHGVLKSALKRLALPAGTSTSRLVRRAYDRATFSVEVAVSLARATMLVHTTHAACMRARRRTFRRGAGPRAAA